VYLVGRCGRIRDERIGEVHDDQPSGRRAEAQIESVLAGPSTCR